MNSEHLKSSQSQASVVRSSRDTYYVCKHRFMCSNYRRYRTGWWFFCKDASFILRFGDCNRFDGVVNSNHWIFF